MNLTNKTTYKIPTDCLEIGSIVSDVPHINSTVVPPVIMELVKRDNEYHYFKIIKYDGKVCPYKDFVEDDLVKFDNKGYMYLIVFKD